MAVVIESDRIPMSLKAFEQLPEGPPFFDYISGVAIKVNRPSARHQRIQVELTHFLDFKVRELRLGAVYHVIDVKLDTREWIGPDIVYIPSEARNQLDEKGDFYGVPGLVIEISSPTTRSYDRGEKFDLYSRNKVPFLWFVEQDSLFTEEFRWTVDGYLRCSRALPGEVFKPERFPEIEINISDLMKTEDEPETPSE